MTTVGVKGLLFGDCIDC